MIAIMISGKPKWSALIMNGYKTLEVRKNKGLYKAIQKLINEYGYAEIYWYCTKDRHSGVLYDPMTKKYEPYMGTDMLNGKVLFKFRCYKVEELKTCERHNPELLHRSCLNASEFYDYLMKGKNFLGRVLGCAIHISNLEIFDKPKELENGWFTKRDCRICPFNHEDMDGDECIGCIIEKAPQNFCYIEVEE